MTAKTVKSIATTRELDPVIIQRHLDDLENKLTVKPITANRLDQWISNDPVRRDLLSDTVWGSIRWRKSMGRPITPTLASAFDIEHIHWQTIVWLTPEGFRHVDIETKHREPTKWDVPDNSEYYRVTFMTYQGGSLASGPVNRIRVSFAPGVAWERRIQVTTGYRSITPLGILFSAKAGERIVLEPFSVVIKSLSLR